MLSERLFKARPVARQLAWTCEMLVRRDGRVHIADLVRRIGWSERHTATAFRTEFGLTPKAFARVLRFGSALRALTAGTAPGLAELAVDCGYYDQSHFTKDFQEFAGLTPTALMACRLPSGAGFSAL